MRIEAFWKAAFYIDCLGKRRAAAHVIAVRHAEAFIQSGVKLDAEISERMGME